MKEGKKIIRQNKEKERKKERKKDKRKK